MLYNIKNAKIVHNRENIFMKHIFKLFLVFLLPTLPAFGVSNFDGFTGFKQSYQSCALDVKKSGFDLEISDLPEKYQTMYKNHAKETFIYRNCRYCKTKKKVI